MIKPMILGLIFFLIACNKKEESASTFHQNQNEEQQSIFENNNVKQSVPVQAKSSKPENGTGQIISSNQQKNEIQINGNETIDTNYKNYLVGKTNFSSDNGFVLVDSKHSNKTTYLRTQVYRAFLEMNQAAKQDGINLIIVSGARSFDHQKSIWERKWNAKTHLEPVERAKEILKYSSMPMSSRHHWGTDFDLNNLENKYFESGEGLKIYNWLTKNASEYGFCQVYTNKNIAGRTGYEMEKWHWSYMPLASQVLERYNKKISIDDFQGFQGSETAKELNVIENYVNGIANCNQ